MVDLFKTMKCFVSALPQNGQAHEILDRAIEAGEAIAREMLSARVELLDDNDRQAAKPYMDMGWFKTLAGDEKAAAWMLALELERVHGLVQLRSRFKRYQAGQAIFIAVPQLLEQSRDRELILHLSADTIFHDGVVHRSGHYMRLEPFLRPGVALAIKAMFPHAPMFLRLDPHFVWAERPKSFLSEATIVPADPHWWRDLGIDLGQRKGSIYTLSEDSDPKLNLAAYWDYHVYDVRRLEVHAKRSKTTYLSMMIEELVDKRSQGYVLGRCIHWDSHAVRGTSPRTASMKHLDLAINIYEGNSGERRLAQQLSNGKVEKATFRTHLLRIEAVPAQAMLPIAKLFFSSRTLVDEWVEDQFGREHSNVDVI